MNLKYLTEKRAENQEEMQNILNAAKLEKRALTEDEIAKFNELKKLITEIDATINAEEEAREMNIEEKKKEVVGNNEETENQEEKREERAFVDFIVTGEERAASPGMSYGSNGAIVPTTIAKKIIEKKKLRNFPLFTKKLRSLVPKAHWKSRFMARIMVLTALQVT